MLDNEPTHVWTITNHSMNLKGINCGTAYFSSKGEAVKSIKLWLGYDKESHVKVTTDLYKIVERDGDEIINIILDPNGLAISQCLILKKELLDNGAYFMLQVTSGVPKYEDPEEADMAAAHAENMREEAEELALEQKVAKLLAKALDVYIGKRSRSRVSMPQVVRRLYLLSEKTISCETIQRVLEERLLSEEARLAFTHNQPEDKNRFWFRFLATVEEELQDKDAIINFTIAQIKIVPRRNAGGDDYTFWLQLQR